MIIEARTPTIITGIKPYGDSGAGPQEMQEVCRSRLCPPTIGIAGDSGASKNSVSDHPRKQNRSDTGAEPHRPDLGVEEYESENQCGRI